MRIEAGSAPAELVSSLRQEAAAVRGCFREISVKAIGLAVTATGAILYASRESPAPVLAVPGLFLILLACQRLGIHKFSTANRLLGYQLHLERLPESSSRLAAIGWEEAVRAWRIVQATLFAAVYRTPGNKFAEQPLVSDLLPHLFRLKKIWATRRRAELQTENLWWMQAERAMLGHGKYHAGSYLERMFGILAAGQLLSVLPLLVVVVRRLGGLRESSPTIDGSALIFADPWLTASALLLFALLIVFCLNQYSLRVRRRILEREFLSIHSCAIVWKAVVLAHDLAWNRADLDGKQRYTERLSNIARILAQNVNSVRAFTDDESFGGPWTFAACNGVNPLRRARAEPRIRVPVTAGRDLTVSVDAVDYDAVLIDCSNAGCGVRLECVEHPQLIDGTLISVRSARSGSAVSDWLGAFTRAGYVVLGDRNPERAFGVKFV